MSTMPISFQSVDLLNATEHEYACLSEFKNAMDREYLPDDPPIPFDERIQEWKNMPTFIEYKAYAAWDPFKTKVIVFCRINVFNTGDNEQLARFLIEVSPEYRRQGIGRQALRLLLPFAEAHKRTLWMSFTWDNVPATTLFFERLGARRGSEMKINQLKLAEFDKRLVGHWLEQSKELQADFDLGFWDGAYPDAEMEAVASLFQEVANDQPRDNLEMEDMKFTPEILRGWEKNMFASGNQRWTMYLIDRANKKLIGVTEVVWNPNRPMILDQGFTGIFPAYRGKRLGRWLKAEMLKKIMHEHPEVEFIRTGNANSNAPMLKINVEMGFKPYTANTIWQVETEKIKNYILKRTT